MHGVYIVAYNPVKTELDNTDLPVNNSVSVIASSDDAVNSADLQSNTSKPSKRTCSSRGAATDTSKKFVSLLLPYY